ncbi:MAG: response regulator [Candidatus Riflebacteria bacterium]|nr:response regulator [Candidatus Riflebacteria bacterium]
MTEEMFNILVADDEISFCEVLKDLLSTDIRYNVIRALTPEEAVQKAVNFHVDLVLLDKRFKSDAEGVRVFKKIKELKPETEIVMMTAYPDSLSNHEVFSAGAAAYLLKTDDYEKLLETIKCLMEKTRLRKTDISSLSELRNKNSRLEKVHTTMKTWNDQLLKRLKEQEKVIASSVTSELFESTFRSRLIALCMKSEIEFLLQTQKCIIHELSEKHGSELPEILSRIITLNSLIHEISSGYCNLIAEKNLSKQLFSLNEVIVSTISAIRFLSNEKSLKFGYQTDILPDYFGNPEIVFRTLITLFFTISKFCDSRKNNENSLNRIFFRSCIENNIIKFEMSSSKRNISEFEKLSENDYDGTSLLLITQAVAFHNGNISLIMDEFNSLRITIELPHKLTD